MKRLGLCLLAFVALSGCIWPFESDDYRDRLAFAGNVSAPDTVNVGSTFAVEITTYGTNGCWRRGRDVVRQASALQATITPYDQEFVGKGACTDNLPEFTHVVSLNATALGAFEVGVRTRMWASTGKDSSGALHRTVVVR